MVAKEFWRLAIQSRILTAEQGKGLAKRFAAMPGADKLDDARSLSEWLVNENAISRYQAKVLLAGRPGPFHYGDYQIYDRIGSGRLSGMFRAVHVPTQHPVLLAFLSAEDAGDARRWATIAGQTQAWSRTSHPNLARVYEPVDVRTHKFVVLEDLRGQSLEDLLTGAPRQPGEAAAWTQQIATALAHLHRAKLVSGDVRPATIWICDGQAKLLVDPRVRPTPPPVREPDTTGQLLERADYLAPEFASGIKSPDAKTDVYALGVTLYRMLSGHVPFAGGDVAQKLQRHASEAVQPLPAHVPAALGQLTNYMMAKNVEVRYQDADAVAEQLRPFVMVAPPTPSPPETLGPFLQHVKQKQAALAAASAAPVIHPNAGGDGEAPRPGIQLNEADAPATSLARRPRKKSNTGWIIGGVCAAAAVIAAILIISSQSGERAGQNVAGGPSQSVTNVSGTGGAVDSQPEATPGSSAGQPNNSSKNTSTDAGPSAAPLASDDGQSLWGSPTLGSPLSLDYLPRGGYVYIASRPADLLSTDAGSQVLQAMGEHFGQQLSAWEQQSGVKLAEIDSLLISMQDNGDAFPRPCFVVRLRQAAAKADLLAAWKAQPAADESYYKGAQASFFIPASETDDAVSVFSMGDDKDIQEIVELKGVAPTADRFTPLLASSDADRHVTILFTPFDVSTHFFRDGRKFYFGEPRKAREPLEWLFGDQVNAVAASLHVTADNTFLELRMSNHLDIKPLDVASQLRDRMDEIHGLIETYLVRISPPEYWRRFAFRFPSMFRYLHQQTRVQVDQGLATINAVMPPAAAHNLVFGCEMTLASEPNTMVAAAPTAGANAPATVDELLQLPMSLSFDQLSLEFAMAQLQTDAIENHKPKFDFKVTIIGADLELNGITRNQQIKEFAMRDKPIADLLTALVMKANPITTVKSPNELDQKLVWVIDGASILITTRDAAATKNLKLPPVFQP
ncbi:MAG: serine/threonine protein kinase [Planctomycetales bacterium]|nr:serine/threonine protein kinase [Planctomycetales bacterium]